MLWEVDVDRYDTDSLPLSSMGRFIARMGGGRAEAAEGGWAQCALGTHRSVAKVSKTLLGHGGEREGRGACTYHVLIVSGSHLLPYVSSNARSHYLHFLGLSSRPLDSVEDIAHGSPGEGYLSPHPLGQAAHRSGFVA